mmetsp:Transcript_57682/g.159549  ORF Transcript_57682/g.159549 Transcript_57682/m.159549 type:complete len:201 (-) Transcript_57682:913-1515(-)
MGTPCGKRDGSALRPGGPGARCGTKLFHTRSAPTICQRHHALDAFSRQSPTFSRSSASPRPLVGTPCSCRPSSFAASQRPKNGKAQKVHVACAWPQRRVGGGNSGSMLPETVNLRKLPKRLFSLAGSRSRKWVGSIGKGYPSTISSRLRAKSVSAWGLTNIMSSSMLTPAFTLDNSAARRALKLNDRPSFIRACSKTKRG